MLKSQKENVEMLYMHKLYTKTCWKYQTIAAYSFYHDFDGMMRQNWNQF